MYSKLIFSWSLFPNIFLSYLSVYCSQIFLAILFLIYSFGYWYKFNLILLIWWFASIHINYWHLVSNSKLNHLNLKIVCTPLFQRSMGSTCLYIWTLRRLSSGPPSRILCCPLQILSSSASHQNNFSVYYDLCAFSPSSVARPIGSLD